MPHRYTGICRSDDASLPANSRRLLKGGRGWSRERLATFLRTRSGLCRSLITTQEDSMKAVIKQEPAPGFSYVTDASDPAAGPGQVVVEIAAASLCGTDREFFDWSPAAQAFRANMPVVTGHEGAGTVVEVGEGVTTLQLGDRVALESHLVCGTCVPCRTGNGHECERTRILGMHVPGVFAERVAVPAEICVALPPEVSWETASLLEASGVAVHAIQRSGYAVAGRAVLISGGGPVGLIVAELARALGATHVAVVEPNAYRRGKAEERGATGLHPDDNVVGWAREVTGHRGGVDVAFECSGVAGALATLLKACRTEGQVVMVGHPGSPVAIDIAADINKRGITLRGIFGRRLWDTWEQSVQLVGSGRLQLDWLVTHRMPLREVDTAVDLLSGEAMKVLLVPELD